MNFNELYVIKVVDKTLGPFTREREGELLN